MSFFSRSSKGHHYRNGNQGSDHYQKKGFLGNIMNILGSVSGSNRHRYGNGQPQNYQQPYIQPNSQFQQTPNTSQCKGCGSQIPAGSKFCLQCGMKIEQVLFCGGCGEKLPENAKFCLNCGNKVV